MAGGGQPAGRRQASYVMCLVFKFGIRYQVLVLGIGYWNLVLESLAKPCWELESGSGLWYGNPWNLVLVITSLVQGIRRVLQSSRCGSTTRPHTEAASPRSGRRPSSEESQVPWLGGQSQVPDSRRRKQVVVPGPRRKPSCLTGLTHAGRMPRGQVIRDI